MLVISRKKMESFRIDGNISVTIISIDRGQVRIGIQAPDDIKILRSELVRDKDEKLITTL